MAMLIVFVLQLPQAFLNGSSLYACVSHSTWNLGMLLLSISISFHLFSCTSLVLDPFSSLNPSENSSKQNVDVGEERALKSPNRRFFDGEEEIRRDGDARNHVLVD